MMRWFGAVLYLAALGVACAETDYANNESVQLFQKYLRINTTSESDLSEAVEFWTNLASEEGLDATVYEFTSGYPVIVIKFPGTDSSLGSLMLNSHMDVVPADENDGWTHAPFSGELDDDGVIFGRGTQDMKSVSIQYFEALRRLKANNVTLLRDIYMTLMPDEEVGGENGIVPFLESDVFAAMNVGLELDEGTSYDLPLSPVFYQDKVPWQIQVDCYGESAHGSTFPAVEETATGRCTKVMNKMLAYRESEYVKYSTLGGELNAGAYTSINLNKINGGTANNVIPDHISLVYDIRLNTTIEETAYDAELRNLIEEDNVTMSYIIKGPQSPATLISTDNPYWTTFSQTVIGMGLPVLPFVPPGATDARFVRNAGFPAFGFSPMPNTPLLLHSVNERLPASTFLAGVDIYQALITALANISGDRTSADPSSYVVSTSTIV